MKIKLGLSCAKLRSASLAGPELVQVSGLNEKIGIRLNSAQLKLIFSVGSDLSNMHLI